MAMVNKEKAKHQVLTGESSSSETHLWLDDCDGLSDQFVCVIWDQFAVRNSFDVLSPNPSLPLLSHLHIR